jgi:hypothetical protein
VALSFCLWFNNKIQCAPLILVLSTAAITGCLSGCRLSNWRRCCARYSDIGNVLCSLNGLILWHKFNRIRYKYVVAIDKRNRIFNTIFGMLVGFEIIHKWPTKTGFLVSELRSSGNERTEDARCPNSRQVWQTLRIKLFLRIWQLVSKFPAFYADRKIPWRLPTVGSDPGWHESTPRLHMLFLKYLP